MPIATTDETLVQLRHRLVALGAAKGFILWYAIEKLFETHIGFSLRQIVFIGAITQGCQALLELPTSILADRWGRRNVLLLAQAALLLCCLVLGLSSTLAVYFIGSILWSVSDALTSGVYEAFAYDSIATAGHKRHFRKLYTRMNSSELAALAVAGVTAGILSLHFSLRLPFFLSIVSVVVCSVLLIRLPEPVHVRSVDDSTPSWKSHVAAAFWTVASPSLRWPVMIYVALFGLLTVWYEYYQLLGIDIKLSPVLFGSLISVLTLGMVVGSEIAHRRPGTKRMLVLVWVTVLLTHLVGLRFRNVWWAFASLFVTFIALMLLELYLGIYIQDAINSRQRATVLSMASTLGYLYFFVLAGVFSLALGRLGIRGALTLVSLPLLVLGVADSIKGVPWATAKTTADTETEEPSGT